MEPKVARKVALKAELARSSRVHFFLDGERHGAGVRQ